MKTAYMILVHSLARTGLRMCLSADTNLRVLGDAADAAAGWAEASRLNPDLLLIDPASLSQLHAAGRLPLPPDTLHPLRIVLLTTRGEMNDVDTALRIGVRGFIDSSSPPDALVPALLKIAEGQRFVSPSLLPVFDRPEASEPGAGINPEDRLSAREMEVFALTAEGLEAKEIGDRLGISPRTVDVHRASMRQKLGLIGVHELIRFAVTWSRDRLRSRREDRFCQQTHPLLLVEDDEVDVLSIERALSQLRVRFPIETKRNGEEALDWLRSSPSSRPFLILLDVNMPRMNGHEFLAELRKDPELRGIPVIVFTTSTLDADRKRMYDTGVTGFMVKPTRTDEFTQMFRALAEFWGFNSPPSPSAPAGIPAVANVEAGRVAAPASRN